MVVEPESLCWVTGRMVQAHDGVTWAEEFARLPALEAVVRDDGTGLGKGVKLKRTTIAPKVCPTSTIHSTSSIRSAKGDVPCGGPRAQATRAWSAPTRLKRNSTIVPARANRVRVMAHR